MGGNEPVTESGANMTGTAQGDSLTIRRATQADAAALGMLKSRTFRETFVDGPVAIPYSAENIALFEAECYAPEAVARELADPRRAQWVAQDAAGDLLAYAHAGPCKLPHAQADAHQGELYQLYVRADRQGTGLGRVLMDRALDWLAQTLPGPVWIGVYSANYKAQAIYAQRGFEKVGDYFFKVGTHRDHEFILRRD